MSGAGALPIAAIGSVTAAAPPEVLATAGGTPVARPAASSSFAQIMLDGVDAVNRRVVNADAMVRAFAVDDSIPLHQVTFALEEARLSMELMMQVRARLVESYQRMMEMQL